MRRRAAGHGFALALFASLLLLPRCELESQGTADRSFTPPDASAGGTSGAGGRADAGPDREASDSSFDVKAEGGELPDATSDGDGASDSGVLCGVDLPAPGGLCPLECTAGCWGAKCYIGCVTPPACQNQLVRCPSGFDCEIACSGPQSCLGARIQCESRQTCLVHCSGLQACQGATVHCGNGSCAMICQGGSCSQTVMNCGPGDCRSLCFLPPYPTVNCQGACNCTPC